MNDDNLASPTPQDVTQLLRAWGGGDAVAAENLTDIVYAQIRAMASKQLRRSGSSMTLQPTELANEMFMRLLEAEVDWRDRRHFFGVVSAALRNILIDSARARGSEKRGGGKVHVTLSAANEVVDGNGDAEALHEALVALRELDERKHEIVEFHYLLGLKREEIAQLVGVSVPTVDRELRFARAWLKEQLQT
jgi:RNA polymerase sigma factor (TIGR02999 family)